MKAPGFCGGYCVATIIASIILLNFIINHLYMHFGGFDAVFADASGKRLKHYAMLKDKPTGFILNFRDEYVAGRGKDHFDKDTADVKADIYNFYNVGGKVVYVSGNPNKMAYKVFSAYHVLKRLCKDTEEEIYLDNDISMRVKVIENMSVFGLHSIGTADYFSAFYT